MTSTEYRAAIASLGLSQGGASRLFGVDPRTSRRWALGELPVPRPVALCLLLMLANCVSAEDAESLLNHINRA
jgi:hypothetical protein